MVVSVLVDWGGSLNSQGQHLWFRSEDLNLPPTFGSNGVELPATDYKRDLMAWDDGGDVLFGPPRLLVRGAWANGPGRIQADAVELLPLE